MSFKTRLAAFANAAPSLFDIPPNPIAFPSTSPLINPSRPRNQALPRFRTSGKPSPAGTKLARKAIERTVTIRHR